jgi:hypothetical protein
MAYYSQRVVGHVYSLYIYINLVFSLNYYCRVVFLLIITTYYK